VKIDFGDVTMNMRNLLRKMGKKSIRPGNVAARPHGKTLSVLVSRATPERATVCPTRPTWFS
jgi:hypothetical protein